VFIAFGLGLIDDHDLTKRLYLESLVKVTTYLQAAKASFFALVISVLVGLIE
jgi:hypothetical protein